MNTPAFIRALKSATPCAQDWVLVPIILYHDGCRMPLEVDYPVGMTDYEERLQLAAHIAAEAVEDRLTAADSWAEWRVIAVSLTDPTKSHDETDQAVAYVSAHVTDYEDAMAAPEWWAERNKRLRDLRDEEPDTAAEERDERILRHGWEQV